MKGGSCTYVPLTSTLTLHHPFEKSGYGPATLKEAHAKDACYGSQKLSMKSVLSAAGQ